MPELRYGTIVTFQLWSAYDCTAMVILPSTARMIVSQEGTSMDPDGDRIMVLGLRREAGISETIIFHQPGITATVDRGDVTVIEP